MWNGIPQPQMPPQQPYQQGGIAPPVPGIQNRPRLEPIDWNLVAVLNADIIRRTKDYDSLQKLVQMFMGAKLYPGSSRILVHPLCLRLCQLLQVAFEYLNFCQTELSTSSAKLETENTALKEKASKLESKIKKDEQIIKLKSIPYDKCPVCKKKFKNLEYVDRHMQNRHSELGDAWNIIRGREHPKEKEDDVQKILDKIDNLKNSLRRGSNKKFNKSVEQELLDTQQELMDAEELREQQEMKQNEEIRRQLFAAADDLNSSMTLYKEHTQNKKPKKSKQQVAIVNLFDQNAEVNPNDYQNYPNAEPSPFNKNQEDEAAKNKRINDFFNQPVNPFQKHQYRPTNEIEDGPNWETQMNSRNKVVNPFQNKANQFQLSVPPDNNNNNNNEYIPNQVNENNMKFEDEFGFGEMNNNNFEIENVQPIMNTGFKNNFSIDNMNHNDVQIVPQSKQETNENDNIVIKLIPKQAILAAKKFISRKNDDKGSHSRVVNASSQNIEQMILMIGEKVHNEVQRLGPNGAASVMIRQEYGDNDPNYLQLRKQIQQKLEMEYPIDGTVTKVKKGFDLVHTEDLAAIKDESQNHNRFTNNYNEINTDVSDPLYSSPSKEKLIINKNNINDYGDSQFTSAFEFQSSKNKQQETDNEKDKEEETKVEKSGSPKKNKIEISEVISASSNIDLPKSKNATNSKLNDNKKPDDDEWSYITSSVSEKTEAKQDEKEKTGQKSPSVIKDVNPHSISFDSSSTSSKLKTKPKPTKDNQNKSEFDFIQSDMKPNFSDSPSRKTETQAISPVQNPKISASIIKGNNSSGKSNKNSNKNNSKSAIDDNNDQLISISSEKVDYKTPERNQPNKSDAISLEIFKSPVISNSSNSNLSGKSKSKTNSNRKLLLDDDEDVVDNLSDIENMKNLSENSEKDLKKSPNVSSSKIEPLSEDEFNFPAVSTDSFSFGSNDEHDGKNKNITKDDLDKKNQLSNRRENNKNISKVNYQNPSYSNLNSNLANNDSESHQSNVSSTSKSKQSRMSVLSSAIRIGRADDTKAIFQSSSINDANSPPAGEVEPVISRRKSRNSPIKNPNKELPITKNTNIMIDDLDPIEQENEKKRKYDEYKKIADEKFRKEFDFDLDNLSDNEQESNKKPKDDALDEFELTGKSNDQNSLIEEEEELDDSEDESGLANLPPRIEFHLKALDEDNEIPVKNKIDNSNSNNRPGITVVRKTNTKFGQNPKSYVEANDENKTSSNTKINNTNNSTTFQDGKKTILKQTGVVMINKPNKRYGQPRSDYDSTVSKIDDDDQNPKKQFNEESDKKNQLLNNSFLKNSRNFNISKNLNLNHNESSDDDKYGYVSDDDDEINGLPRPDYFEALNNDQKLPNKNLKPKRKQEDSLFSSPLPPDPSISSDSVYQPENERMTFYEKKTKSSKTKASSSVKRPQLLKKKDDPFESTNANPPLINDGMHSDDF